jgi:transcriptional regulator with XRE-family HTH domain
VRDARSEEAAVVVCFAMLAAPPFVPLSAFAPAKLIRDAREAADLSQQELADAAKVSRDQVARLESGGGSVEALVAVLAALDRLGLVVLADGRVDQRGAPGWAEQQRQQQPATKRAA